MRQPSSGQTDEAQGGRADASAGRTRGLARRLRAFGTGDGLDRPAAQETARFVPLRAVGMATPGLRDAGFSWTQDNLRARQLRKQRH
jgi:hypothetical protein